MYNPNQKLQDFVQGLPKTETHLHLEGSCPIELIREASPGQFDGDPPMWSDDFRYESFDQFKDMYDQFCASVFVSAEAYYRCAKIVLQKCADQNVKYVETSFHVGAVIGGNIDGEEIVDAVLAAAPEGMDVRVFMGMCHNDYTGLGKKIIDECIHWNKLTGIDLHGPEYWPLEPWTEKVWKSAKDAGKFLKAHAGEFMPASFVRRCIEELGVRRIQHGVRCIEDPNVVELIKDLDVTLDICPISNLKLQVEGITKMSEHPIRELFNSGVRCTINSDDPFMFGNSLSEEYYALATDLNFTDDELKKIAQNGFNIVIN